MQRIRIKSCVYVEPKRISSELKHSLSNKETSPQKKKLKIPQGIPSEYKKYKQKTILQKQF